MKRYLDLRFLLFVALAGGASVISAHGAWVFFGYLVEPWLAGVFTVVIAAGIIGLDAAATLEPHIGKRAAYLSGMALFLGMEVLANYFSGQASFVVRVRSALALTAPGADLLTITATYPTGTRVLVVVFLSLASVAVAAFVFAATTRVVQILSGLADPLRTEVERLQVAIRTLSAEHTAAFRVQSARFRHCSASRRGLVRSLTRALRAARRQAAQAQEQVRSLSSETERARADLAGTSALTARLTSELAELSAASTLDVRALAQRMRDEGVALRTIGLIFEVNEKTIRNWTVDVRTNGHAREVA